MFFYCKNFLKQKYYFLKLLLLQWRVVFWVKISVNFLISILTHEKNIHTIRMYIYCINCRRSGRPAKYYQDRITYFQQLYYTWKWSFPDSILVPCQEGLAFPVHTSQGTRKGMNASWWDTGLVFHHHDGPNTCPSHLGSIYGESAWPSNTASHGVCCLFLWIKT